MGKFIHSKTSIRTACLIALSSFSGCTTKLFCDEGVDKSFENKDSLTIKNQPNILFFITDDESWIERSAYGWSNLPTPNFDRVAEQGVLFSNAFCSAPSSAPSRASILTGRNFWELEQGAFIQAFLPEKYTLFTHLLYDKGYHVGYTHKTWGPGIYLPESHSNVSGLRYNKAKMIKKIQGITDNDYAGNFELFLKDKNAGQPFFFWAGLSEPHTPYGPENYKLLENEYGITLDQIKLPPGIEDTQENRQNRANYMYEICYTDLHLGRMLKTLEEAGELENTLIVVTSDNGTHISRNGKLVGKTSPYDLGVHEPLAIMWPAHIKGGRKVTDFVSFSDFAPTFLHVAGINIPTSMSGKSLLPQLLSKESGRIEHERNFVVTGLEWHGEFDPVSNSFRTIRDDDYAYIVRYANVDESGNFLTMEEACNPVKVEFYDFTKDPWQLNDLSDNPNYIGEMRRLSEKLYENGIKTKDPRVTGDMDIFIKTREYVQERKRLGYENTKTLPFEY